MSQLLNAEELKEQVSLVDLLSRLNYEPVRKSGKENMYHSMLRDGDNDPSFSVDDKMGVWYDHGTGKGGNIIDFGIAYWPELSFKEVIEKIQTIGNVQIVPGTRSAIPRTRTRNYAVGQIKSLGTHPAITSYLQGRGIFDIARKHMSEVYYTVQDKQNGSRQFFAAGWKNEAGSWEVRNKYFKGCLGQKAISFIPGDEKKVVVFEGFMNYLSWLKDGVNTGQSAIILNTLSLLGSGITKAKQFSSIDLYLDRDRSGFQATKEFTSVLPYASDRSALYEHFNDYNDRLVASLHRSSEAGRSDQQRKGYTR